MRWATTCPGYLFIFFISLAITVCRLRRRFWCFPGSVGRWTGDVWPLPVWMWNRRPIVKNTFISYSAYLFSNELDRKLFGIRTRDYFRKNVFEKLKKYSFFFSFNIRVQYRLCTTKRKTTMLINSRKDASLANKNQRKSCLEERVFVEITIRTLSFE